MLLKLVFAALSLACVLSALLTLTEQGRAAVLRWAERRVGGIGYGEIMDGPQEQDN